MADKNLKIDLDEGTVLMDSKWQSEKDIKKMIDDRIKSGDYDVADLANTLQVLEKALKNSKEITVRVSKEMARNYESLAKSRDETFGNILREALGIYLAKEGASGSFVPVEEEEEEEDEEEVEEETEEEKESEEEESKDEDEEEDDDTISSSRRRGSSRRRRSGRRSRSR